MAAFAPQGGLGLEKQDWETHSVHLSIPDPSCRFPHLKARQPNCCQYFFFFKFLFLLYFTLQYCIGFAFYSSLSCRFTVEVTIQKLLCRSAYSSCQAGWCLWLNVANF